MYVRGDDLRKIALFLQFNILKEAVNKTEDNELIQSFKRYEKLLVDNGQIDEIVSYISSKE